MNRLKRSLIVIASAGMLTSCVVRPAYRPLPPEPGVQPASRFTSPLKSFTVLSPFGTRGGKFHTGIDIRGKREGGDPVLASRDGTVVRSETRNGYGRLIEIQHTDGYSTRYAHLRRIEVRNGDKVKQGEEIGTVGSSGRATGPHLHFEILTPAYRFVDPAPYLAGTKE